MKFMPNVLFEGLEVLGGLASNTIVLRYFHKKKSLAVKSGE